MVTDPLFQELIKDEELLFYQYYWLQKTEADQFQTLGKHLGSFWEYSDLFSSGESEGSGFQDKSKIMYPLSLVFNADLLKEVKKRLKPPLDSKGSTTADTVNLSTLDARTARSIFKSYISNKDKELFEGEK